MPDSPDASPPLGPSRGLAEGTRLFTLRGEVAVESLRPGDMLVSLSGRGAPMKRLAALHRTTGPAIRLAAGALGPGIPARDLVLGADQLLRLDGLLIPARLLPETPGIGAEPALPLLVPELAEPDLVVAAGTPVAALPVAEPPAPDPLALAALRARLAPAPPAADPRDALLDTVLDGEEALSTRAALEAGAAPLIGPATDG